MRVSLTPAKLAAKPKAKPFEIHDAQVSGLFVRVQPSGAKSFYVSWARGRRRVLGKVGVLTIEAARIKARRILNEAAENGEPSITTRKRAATLGDYLTEHYKPMARAEHKDAEGTLKAVETEFGHLFKRPLSALSQMDFERYKLRKLGEGAKPATVNRHFDRIRAVLRAALRGGHTTSNPLANVTRPEEENEPIVRYLDADKETRLRAELAKRDAKMRAERSTANAWRRARGYREYPEVAENGFGNYLTPMVLLAMNTGMRRGELRQITWADVDLDRALLTVRAGYAKNRRARAIPLNAEAVDVLRRWRAQREPDGAIFGVERADKAWKAVLKAAKIEDFRFHDLRHHFASWLVMRGVALNTVRDLLGHADIAMTLRYADLAPEVKAEAVAKLARLAA